MFESLTKEDQELLVTVVSLKAKRGLCRARIDALNVLNESEMLAALPDVYYRLGYIDQEQKAALINVMPDLFQAIETHIDSNRNEVDVLGYQLDKILEK